MKVNFEWQGLTFEDQHKEQKGEVKPINFSMEADATEMIELIKAEGQVISELIKLGKDFVDLEKQKEARRREERRNSNKRF